MKIFQALHDTEQEVKSEHTGRTHNRGRGRSRGRGSRQANAVMAFEGANSYAGTGKTLLPHIPMR